MPSSFAVFLSHNARDKSAVEEIAMKLRSDGVEPWLDAWMLEGGRPWQEELAAGLAASSSFAFFVGPNGVGDWARAELENVYRGALWRPASRPNHRARIQAARP